MSRPLTRRESSSVTMSCTRPFTISLPINCPFVPVLSMPRLSVKRCLTSPTAKVCASKNGSTLPSLCSICYETPSQSNVIEMAKLVQVILAGLPAPVLLYVICHLCPDVQFEVVGKDVQLTTVY